MLKLIIFRRIRHLRYLQLVNPGEMVALEDSSGAVVSLPPLTNSENTKVTIILPIPIPNPFPNTRYQCKYVYTGGGGKFIIVAIFMFVG